MKDQTYVKVMIEIFFIPRQNSPQILDYHKLLIGLKEQSCQIEDTVNRYIMVLIYVSY